MSDIINEVSKISSVRELGNEELAAHHLNVNLTMGLSDVLEVQLENGNTFSVDQRDTRASVWREFLDWQQKEALPVFIAADEESRLVAEIMPASKRLVEAVDPLLVDGRLRVLFRASPAIFFLNPALPGFTELRARLESAARDKSAVLVTHHPLTYEVIDAREAIGEASASASSSPPSTPATIDVEITLERANKVFQDLAKSDIPFDHIRDCCTARAQKMCGLMLQNGIRARKIWNYGKGFALNQATLFVKASIDPSGKIFWRYHVAPIVNVVDGATKTLVFDPSLFKEPVPIPSWLLIQNDPNSTQEFTDAENFSNAPNSSDDLPDPGPVAVNEKLNAHLGEKIVLHAFRALFEPPL